MLFRRRPPVEDISAAETQPCADPAVSAKLANLMSQLDAGIARSAQREEQKQAASRQ